MVPLDRLKKSAWASLSCFPATVSRTVVSNAPIHATSVFALSPARWYKYHSKLDLNQMSMLIKRVFWMSRRW